MSETDKVSEPWRALLNQLERHFNVSDHRCLLWVDPAQNDPFQAHPLVEERRVRVPIRHPRFDPMRAPYLVALDLSLAEDMKLFSASVELAWRSWELEQLNAMRGQPICGWVSTVHGAKDVASHWAMRCHLHIRARQAKLLRFQDPGVREWLWPAFNDGQRHALLGPASAVHAVGRGQTLIHHESTRAADAATAGRPVLELDQSQWKQVDNYASLHAGWLRWRNTESGRMSLTLSLGWERAALSALAHASTLGLYDVRDRELFAMHVLQIGADFHRHPRLQQVWPKTQAGEFYGSVLEEVTGHCATSLAAHLISLRS